MALGEYVGAGSSITKWLYRLNWDANDASWNANNWTATNVAWTSGILWSGAGSFNGASSFINLSTLFNSVFNQSSWTISLRSNLTTGSWTYGSKYIANDNNTGQRQFSISLTTGWKIYIEMYSTPNVQVTSTLSVPSWSYNLVVIYWSSFIKAYVNTIEYINTWMNILPTTTNATNIWRRQYPSYEWYFWWVIDEVIIENRSWTVTEIQKYYTYTKGRFWI